MSPSGRRVILVFAALPVVLVTVALIYMAGMHLLEGDERTFWQALEWASETMTTTGYGADAEWRHPVMILFVVGLQFIGVFLVYMLVPLLMLPLLEARFEQRLPRQAPSGLSGHVVIYRFGAAVETLVEELTAAGVDWLVIEHDAEVGRDLLDRWHAAGSRLRRGRLIHNSSLQLGLERARLTEARALIANGGDEENAVALMVARELGFEGEVLALVEEPQHGQPLEVAGASEVFTPRLELGSALAARASQHLAPRIAGDHLLDPRLEVSEIRVSPDSSLAGQTLREADLANRTGATVLGQWVGGELDAHPEPATVIAGQGTLLAVGEPEAIADLRRLATGGRPRPGGRLLLAGYGEVGQRVAKLLREADEPLWVIDRQSDLEGVDLCGDIADSKVIEQLDLENARAIILALDNDSATLFSVLILRQHAADLPIIARVNHAENLDRLYKAGADFALSISQVSAQSLVYRLLGRDILALGGQLEILRTDAGPIGHLSALDIRRRSGCSVVAVLRGEQALTTVGPDLVIEPGDTVFVCGSRAAVERFSKLFGV